MHVRSEAARDGRHIVPKQAYAHLRVAAALALRTLHHAVPRTHDPDEDAAPTKRQKAWRCLWARVSPWQCEQNLLLRESETYVCVPCCSQHLRSLLAPCNCVFHLSVISNVDLAQEHF